jgi:hypothetical protein
MVEICREIDRKVFFNSKFIGGEVAERLAIVLHGLHWAIISIRNFCSHLHLVVCRTSQRGRAHPMLAAS